MAAAFSDVEGTLVDGSIPRMPLAIGRRMGMFPAWQVAQVAALGMSARILPGTLRQQALLQAVVRSMAGHTRDEVERLVEALLPEVMAHLKPAMLGRQRRHGNLRAYTVLSECSVAS